jgi:hypothetical protein
VVAQDVKSLYLRSDAAATAASGVVDLVVVTTKYVALVAPSDRSQDVRQQVERLRADGGEEATQWACDGRPWAIY